MEKISKIFPRFILFIVVFLLAYIIFNIITSAIFKHEICGSTGQSSEQITTYVGSEEDFLCYSLFGAFSMPYSIIILGLDFLLAPISSLTVAIYATWYINKRYLSKYIK